MRGENHGAVARDFAPTKIHFNQKSPQRYPSEKQMKKGVVFSSKDESGWRGGVCERLLDEMKT
jgi:hypothetical protein